MSKAISYPFTLDVYGTLKTTTDVNKIYLDRVLTLLSTNVGQRPILQDYGTDLMQALFENENNLQAAINQAVRQAVGRWIPEVSVDQITVGELDDAGIANVGITLRLPDSTLTSITVSSSVFSADGTITR